MRKILIIGGYGRFGARLVRLLADEAELELIIAGRSKKKAEALCAEPAAATLTPLRFERNHNLASQIARLQPEVVVDAAGPFQSYGKAPYSVPEAALRARAHYLDLADAPGFVAGIGCLNTLALEAGRMAISGASSVPALSFAAARSLKPALASVETYTGGISPSPHARVGLSAIRAIASYTGRPIPIIRAGKPCEAFGLMDSMSHNIQLEGAAPLGARRFSLVDVPDLLLARQVFPGLKALWFGAAPQPELGHSALTAMAWLVRLGVLPSLVPLARLMEPVANHLNWGEQRGGMFIRLTGPDHAGRQAEISWNLIAEGDSGPSIPSIPAAALIKRWLAGQAPELGARSAHEALELTDFEPFFQSLGIRHGIVDHQEL
ncbi:MAG: hypothetical protein GY948_14680 [Alphaproteobacteria bacterium]|nr:hypothetical protein [Alphaproteobacteria bacterium]